FMAGESEQAMRQLQKTLELAPEFSQARTILAIGHLSKGEPEQALQIAEDAISETPDSVDAYLLKLMVLQHNKDYSQAEKLLQTMKKKFPDALAVHLARGSFFAERGQSETARAAYQQVLKQDEKHVGALMRLAKLERDAGNSEAMGEWLAKANNVDPAALMPALAYAEYLFKTGQPEPATRVLGQVSEAERDNQYYLSLLGQIQLSSGETQQAVTSYKRLTQVVPGSAPARMALARARLVDNDKEGALADLEVALKLDPDHLQAKVQKTQLQFELGDKRGANFSLNELLNAHPDSPAVWTLQGWMALRERDFVLAENAYEKVWNTLASPGVATEYARALMGLGKRDQAVELLETTLSRHQENIDLLFALATVYDAEKEGAKSIPLYEKVIKVRPTNYVALNNLAWLLKETNPKRALALATRAHEAVPKNPAVLDTYGLILLEQGQSEKAERILEQASSLSDFDPNMSFHYAQSLVKNGKAVQAKRVLQNALAQSSTFPEAKEAEKLLNSL
ncbi:MAG TPA: PEP-CTERM system TPR-repeat protein PrsT, partial [Gammaproteobacteria bacterium]|nr:PEP-CTERM system TPR-repeat protein PrsT [Gammaproteobacteria bacterium]